MWITGLIICLGWIISLCFHEFSHALVAYFGGDTTVKDKGYLTFNPLKYTEPGLSLIMPLVFVLIGGIGLPGGAVYINRNLLKNRIWSSCVSAAGPLSNAIFAFLLVIPFWLTGTAGSNLPGILNSSDPNIFNNLILPSLAYLIYIEIFAVLFNLLPIPPFDGYGIIKPWLSKSINTKLNRYGKYSYYAIFGMFLFIPQFGFFFSSIIRATCNLIGIGDLVIFQGQFLFAQPVNKLMAIIIIISIAYLLRLNENTWYQKGHNLTRSKQDKKALEAYNKAIKIKPNYTEAWFEKGNSLFRLARYEEAALSYQKVLKLDPNNYDALINLGHVSFNSGNSEEAIDAYQQAIKLKSEDKAYIHLSRVFFKLDKQDKAILLLEEAIKINPQESDLWIVKAGYLYNLEKYREVIIFCQEAVTIHKQNTEIWYYMGIALQQLKKYEEAETIFTKILTFEPQSILTLSAKANLYYVQKKYTAAINSYQKVVAIQPESDRAWYNIACCYSLLERSGEAIVALEKAVEINPEQTRKAAKEDTNFAFLRKNKDFQDLVK